MMKMMQLSGCRVTLERNMMDFLHWHLEALGLHAVQHLDGKSTAEMWADDNMNYTQQRITKKHP